MNLVLAVPVTVRLLLLAIAGALVGAMVNWLAERIRWQPTFLSPWSRDPAGSPPRPGHQYLPIWGWLSRRQERDADGGRVWLRPLAIELGLAVALPALYWYETIRLALVPGLAPSAPGVITALHCAYASHVILITAMLIASLVDLDEKIIPDAITVPATLVGLLMAALFPASLLPQVIDMPRRIEPVTLASPHAWPTTLDGFPHSAALLLGLACVWLWCGGLLPRVWRLRRGWRIALGLFLGRLRDRMTCRILGMALALSLVVLPVWYHNERPWRGLLTALVGMAATGGFTWVVRVVAGGSIGREALGFGDVTLMSMIGAFLGWQAGLIVFFVAPFFALGSGLLQWITRRDPEIPYGPFLCLAALLILLRWPAFWELGREVFALGSIIPVALMASVVLMGAMLTIWHWILGR